jgi:hypothetical protein
MIALQAPSAVVILRSCGLAAIRVAALTCPLAPCAPEGEADVRHALNGRKLFDYPNLLHIATLMRDGRMS